MTDARLSTQPPPAITGVIIPAAGLGTRLRPLTFGCAKELLPLSSYPALVAPLLEATPAGVRDVVVVTSPEKPGIAALCQALDRAAAGSAPAVAQPTPTDALVALWQRLRIRLVYQPQPLGVLDAVEIGLRALPPTTKPCAAAVLFPDLLHLPDQRALSILQTAHTASGCAVFGLHHKAATSTVSDTLAVRLAPPWDGASIADIAAAGPGQPLPIVALRPAREVPSWPLQTTLGQIQSAAWNRALHRHCRAPDGSLRDGEFLAALNHLATDGQLVGALLPGEILDQGTLPGYRDAALRFARGDARFVDLP